MAQINKPTDYFNTVLWSGNSTDNTAITTGHATDFIWAKIRGFTYSHRLADSVRGASKTLFSDLTNAESSDPCYRSFDNDGFTLGTDGGTNASGNTYVGWSWVAGGSASSNTDGSITSNVSASTTSGFSIVSYTGTGATGGTVGHGLGVAPSMIIAKDRDDTPEWVVYHKTQGKDKYLLLNSTAAVGTVSNVWGSAEPTSSVFGVYPAAGAANNKLSDNIIAYCFAEKKGFSKFGSYVGNGGTGDNGVFIYTGFKPAFVMVKSSSYAATRWLIKDTTRNPYNVADKHIPADLATTEGTSNNDYIDILSNGFKYRGVTLSENYNNSGESYIYMAFAEQPLVGTNNIPATAR